jgi:hypothetical protein
LFYRLPGKNFVLKAVVMKFKQGFIWKIQNQSSLYVKYITLQDRGANHDITGLSFFVKFGSTFHK